MAAQVWSATTATPPSGFIPCDRPTVSSSSTCRTPGTLSAASRSKDMGLRPTTGLRSMEAWSMPSIRASMPKTARPVTMSGTSTSFRPLPM